jgi:hypothetical protein
MTDSNPVSSVTEETNKTEQQEASVTDGKKILKLFLFCLFFSIPDKSNQEVAVVLAENVVDQNKNEEKENLSVESPSDVERESKEPSSEPQFKDAEKVVEDDEEGYDGNDSEYEDVDEEEEEIEEKNEAPVQVKQIELKFD